MKTDPAINTALNGVLKVELTAINQLFLHARMHDNWGLGGLGGQAYKASIAAMKHADRVIKRILFLEGLPNLQDLGRLAIGETPVECLGADLDLDRRLRGVLAEAIATCERQRDFQTRELLNEMLHQVEEAIDWHETQQSLLADLGPENFLQSHLDETEED